VSAGNTTPTEHLLGTLSLLQLIERAQRELLDAGREIERDAWALRHKIEAALRPVRDYLHHQPIGDVVEVLSALSQAEALILMLPHVATGDATLRGSGRRRRRSPPSPART
jgi:hypothetical protein